MQLRHVDAQVGAFGVSFQIGRGGASGFHGGHFAETPGQRQREKTDARVEVPGFVATGGTDGPFVHGGKQEAVHLKEGFAADVKFVVIDQIVERALHGAGDFFGQPVEEDFGDRTIGLHDVPLDVPLVREGFEREQEVRPAAVANHAGEGSQRFVQFGRRDGALVDFDQIARAHLAEADFAFGEVELRAIAVAVRVTRDRGDLFDIELDFSGAAQRFREDFPFEAKLGGVIRVLVLAAAAKAEDGAGRLDAFGRGLGDSGKLRALHVLFRSDALCRDRFTGEDKRNEDDLSIHAAQSVAAIYQFFNLQFVRHLHLKGNTVPIVKRKTSGFPEGRT